MKVLLSAYACEPNRGSEPGVGWNTAWEIAKYHEVWVLTRPDDGRENIAAVLAAQPNPNLHMVYCTLPLLGGFWQMGSIAFVLHYYLWQVQAFFVARRLHQQIGFDVAHHVTFVRYSSPSFLSLLPIPLVWGPVGGGEMAPAPFWQDFRPKARLYEILRLTAHRLGELDPFARLTAQRAACVRVTTADTAQRVRSMGAKAIEILPEAALALTDLQALNQCGTPPQSPLRFISIGRLLHWKGFHLGLQAFALANIPDAEYWIVGKGAERQALEQLATELGIADRVTFWGELKRSAVMARLGECHVVVHPSLHDSGGWTCLEAMAAGRPVLCLDLGGPSVEVSDASGIKVAAYDPEQVVQDMAIAMRRLAADPNLRSQMGAAGQQIIREQFNWEAKGRSLAHLYETLLDETLREGLNRTGNDMSERPLETTLQEPLTIESDYLQNP